MMLPMGRSGAAINGLLQGQRNRFLHPEFEPSWEDPGAGPAFPVPQGDTRFDPFMGTPWGQFLDAAGASDPQGAKMGGQFGNKAIGTNQAMRGLQASKPKPAADPYSYETPALSMYRKAAGR